MKKTKILLAIVLALVLCLTLSLAACTQPCEHNYVGGKCTKCGEADPNYEAPCEHNYVDGKCTKCGAADPNYEAPCEHNYVNGVCTKCGEKDPNAKPQPSKAVITVNPATLEVTPDDEVVLMFGVSATLDGKEIEVIISDDGGFDPDDMKEGTYTITYKAGTGESEATATRTIKVSAPLSQLALEVRQNYLGEQKWQGNLLTFKNALYVELTQDTTLTTQSGVFHNNSENEITLNVEGAYGCSAVLDKNGVVIEGRDGANSKLVNAENPTRAASSVTTIKVDGEDVAVNNAFAKELKIPAGGYAVVIQNKYASEAGADFDGRGFMNYNVIYAVGNVVRLYWVDDGATDGLLTPYVNQAPYFSGNGTVYAQMGDTEFNLENAVKAGLVVKDDNGTFEITDDVTLEEITVSDNGGFDINKIGSYTVTMTVTDGSLSTTITRKVEVKDDYVTLTVGDKTLRVAPEKYIYNQEVTGSSAAKYSMIVLDKTYTGEFATNGYGCAIVLDKFGTLLRIYDGANLGLYDKSGKVAGAAPFTVNTYATYAWEQLGEGETLIVFPNDGGANESRKFGLSLRPVNGSKNYCGELCTLTGKTFEEKQYTFTVGEKAFSAAASAYAFNDSNVTAKNVTSYRMIVYNKDYTGSVALNGYGCAIVLDKYGTLTLVYDGANLGLYDKNGKAASTPFTTANYATYAWEHLGEGETLIVFPNVGGANEARAFGLGLRTDGSIGKTCQLTDVTFLDPNDKPTPVENVVVKIGDAAFTKESEITVGVNPNATAATEYDFYIYTTAFSGKLGFANGYGEAFVIGADNKVGRIYDGANGKYYDAENTAGVQNAEIMTASNYLIKALLSLKQGEYLLVAPNNGGDNLARKFLLDHRTIGAIVEVALPETTITPSEKDATALLANGQYFYNPAAAVNVEAAKPAELDFIVYTYGYNGVVTKVGWSEIFIVDVTTGKVVTIYDGVNGKYYDAANPTGIARTDEMYTLANMSLEAFEKLLPNQMMVIGHNGGRNSNAGRAFLVGSRSLDKEMALVNVTVAVSAAEAVSYAKITVGTKVWYQDATKIAVDAVYTGTPAFAIYHKNYDGALITGGYGVAFIVDEATGKVVKIYDGASGKYYDADHASGATGAGCTAAGYITEAFAALEDGQYLLIAPNGGTTGNVARGLLYGSRVIGTAVSYVLPQTEA